jgi:BirA family transcriptional regulator, biotin operon repressor / biotin---[acetyl-CoA-carboxylase] ligase
MESPSPLPSRRYQFDRWQLLEFAQAGSTNDLAAQFPAWHAVRADTQTVGRGRWRRKWISDLGGLWLSANVPTGPAQATWRALPLAAGLAVTEALASLGGTGLRLRWPNDLLVGSRKLAGLLVDEPRPGLAVVGVGVNVTNTPEAADPDLSGLTLRLADLISPLPSLTELSFHFLLHLGRVHDEMAAHGLSALLPRLNKLWDGTRPVRLDLDEGLHLTGHFTGVDAEGRLALLNANGQTTWHEAARVRQLVEKGSVPTIAK